MTLWRFTIGATLGAILYLSLFAIDGSRRPNAGTDIIEAPGQRIWTSPSSPRLAQNSDVSYRASLPSQLATYESEYWFASIARRLLVLADPGFLGEWSRRQRVLLDLDGVASLTEQAESITELISYLDGIDMPENRRYVALLFVAINEFDGVVISDVMGSLPEVERPAFLADSTALQAIRSPEAVISSVSATVSESALREEVIRSVARVVANAYSQDALDYYESLDDPSLRSEYIAAALVAISKQSPEHAIGLISELTLGDVPRDFEMFRSLASVGPEKLLDLSEQLPSFPQLMARSAAIEEFALRDPQDGISRMHERRLSSSRGALESVVARAYVRTDPNGAWQWALSQGDRAKSVVLAELVNVNPELAHILFLRDFADIGWRVVSEVLNRTGEQILALESDEQYALLLEWMLTADGDLPIELAENALRLWLSRSDGDAQLWIVANIERIPDELVAVLAAEVGRSNLDLATSVLHSLSAEQQSEWMRQVATSLANSNLNGVVSWLSQLQSYPGYESALIEAFSVALPRFGRAKAGEAKLAATLVDDLSPELRARLISTVASAWAQEDPEAASDWVISAQLDARDNPQRVSAIRSVVRNVARSDSAAAMTIITKLSDGELHDVAVAEYVAVDGQLPIATLRSLLGTIGDESIKVRAVEGAAIRLIDRDVQATIEVVEEFVADPSEQQRILSQIRLGPGR